MAEEKAEDMNAATLLSGFHDGFILKNAGEYLIVMCQMGSCSEMTSYDVI